MGDKRWTPGRFVWRELASLDVAQSCDFYAALFGWTYQDVDLGAFTYPVITVRGRGIGGIAPLQGPAPAWMSVVSVPDVDSAARRARAMGGEVLAEPGEIPHVGRFAMLADPERAVFGVLKAAAGDPPDDVLKGVDEFCWESLCAQEQDRTQAFYGEVVGWKARNEPFLDSHLFTHTGDSAVADLQPARARDPAWFSYVRVESVERTLLQAERLGATTKVANTALPTGGSIGLLTDPQGASLGLFAPDA